MSRAQAGQPGAAVQLAGVTSKNLAVSPELLLAAAAAGMCLATSASKRSIQRFVITEKTLVGAIKHYAHQPALPI